MNEQTIAEILEEATQANETGKNVVSKVAEGAQEFIKDGMDDMNVR